MFCSHNSMCHQKVNDCTAVRLVRKNKRTNSQSERTKNFEKEYTELIFP